MQNFWTVFKLLIGYMFKRDKTKGNGWKLLLLILPAIFGLLLVVAIVGGVAVFAPSIDEQGLTVEFLTSMVFFGTFVIFVLGLVPTITHLYLSKDIEFFASLPIGSSAVYFSKLAISYLIQLSMAVVLVVPGVVTVGVVLGLGIWYYLCMTLVVLAIPILPLLVISVLAIPTMYLVSFFKNRSTMTSILFILLFGAGYLIYFSLIGNPNNQNASGQVVDSHEVFAGFINSTVSLKYVLAPFNALIRVATGQPLWFDSLQKSLALSNALNLATFLAFVIVFYTLLRLLSGKIYLNGAIAQLEGSSKLHKISSRDSVKSQFWTLAGKEYKEMIRTPAFAINCLFNTVLSAVMTVLFSNTSKSIDFGDQISPEYTYIVIIMLVLSMGAGISVGACTSISREGDKFYFVKILPVDFKLQIRAKLFVYRCINAISVILSLLVFSIMSGEYLMAIAALGFGYLYSAANINFCAIFDLSRPKLKWNNPSEVIKRNINVQIPVFVSFAFMIVLLIISLACFAVGTNVLKMSNASALVVMWAILYLIAGGLMLLYGHIVNKITNKCIERVEI